MLDIDLDHGTATGLAALDCHITRVIGEAVWRPCLPGPLPTAGRTLGSSRAPFRARLPDAHHRLDPRTRVGGPDRHTLTTNQTTDNHRQGSSFGIITR